DHALDSDPDGTRGEHAREDGEHQADTPIGVHAREHIGADHSDLAMGEVDHPRSLVDDHETDGEQCVDRPDEYARGQDGCHGPSSPITVSATLYGVPEPTVTTSGRDWVSGPDAAAPYA